MTMPALVVHGAKSPHLLRDGSRALAEVLRNAQRCELDGVRHNPKMKLLAPVLADFFTSTARDLRTTTLDGDARRGDLPYSRLHTS